MIKYEKKKDFCETVMTSEKDNISEFNQYVKSDKMPCIVYADFESLIKKVDGCVNNPENSSTTKIGEHISCKHSMSKICAFDHIENKHFILLKRLYEKVWRIFKRTREKFN